MWRNWSCYSAGGGTMVCLLPAAVPEGCPRRRTMGRPAPSAFCRPAHWSRGGGQPLLLARKYKSGEPVLWLPLQQGAQGTLSRCFAVPLKELPINVKYKFSEAVDEWAAARNASGA